MIICCFIELGDLDKEKICLSFQCLKRFLVVNQHQRQCFLGQTRLPCTCRASCKQRVKSYISTRIGDKHISELSGGCFQLALLVRCLDGMTDLNDLIGKSCKWMMVYLQTILNVEEGEQHLCSSMK